MDSSNAVDDKALQQLNGLNGSGDSDGPIPIRTVYVHDIISHVSINQSRNFE